VHSVFVNLDGAQYLAGWRPEAGSLFLPALSDSRVGEDVAVRVGIFGQQIRATLFGKVAVVRRVGRPALGFLAMAARGEPVSFQERQPRWAHERSLEVAHAGATLTTTTLNLSEGGCAIRWAGQLPLVGDVVELKLGTGLFAAKARAIVCWNQPGGAVDRSVGLRIVPGGRGARAWRSLVEKVSRSGARAA